MLSDRFGAGIIMTRVDGASKRACPGSPHWSRLDERCASSTLLSSLGDESAAQPERALRSSCSK